MKKRLLPFSVNAVPRLLFVAFLLASSLLFNARAQSGTVTGTVQGEANQPLAGVTVSVKGGRQSAATDEQGMFTVRNVAGNATLVFTSVGFVSQEVALGGRQNISVGLKSAAGTLSDVVVVSYGRQRQREVTGSIAQLSAAPLQDMPVQQFAQQLQGKIAGVQVAQSSGQPGRGVEFRIRGAASFYASNQPLFVVDGMPVTGSINNINPDEIESFSVLKDASATALYGSRAANGVILITTRHAKPGDSKVEFNVNYGVQKIDYGSLPKPMDAQGFATFMNQRFEDIRKYEGASTATPPAYLDPASYGAGTNWVKAITRTAPFQNYDISIQSAREHSSSTVIFGYQEQQGVLINTSTKLFSLRFNQDFTSADNKLKIGFNMAPSYRLDHNNRINTDALGGQFERAFESSPLQPVYLPDGTFNRDAYSPGMSVYINPVAIMSLQKDDYKTTRILGNAYVNYELVKGLTLKGNAGVDKGAETRQYFLPGLVTGTINTPTGTSTSADNGSWTAEATVVYNKNFGADHHLEALAGYSAQRYSSTGNTITGLGFTSDDITYLSAATSLTGNSSYNAFSLLSGIGRINYNFKGKYLLEGAVRRDGSSRFGANQKWGNFPSVSAGWVVSDETFMKRLPALNFFKIRASYGVTGNNFFPGNYSAQATVGTFYYDFNNTVTQGQIINQLPNAELRWERNKQFDIGFDATFLKGRINLTYDYYHKISDGLIQQRSIPRSSGFTQILYNVGEVELWGHEVSVNSVNISNRNLRWTTAFNISFDRNLIKNLVAPGFIRRNITTTSDYFRQQVGHHLGEFYGFVFQGLYKDAEDLAKSPKYLATAANPNGVSDVGTIKVKDINGDGVIDDVNDRTFIGDPTPDFMGGITNNLTYKNFDLNVNMSYSVGGQILNAVKWAYQGNLDGSRVMLAAAADRWRSPENPGSGIYPRTKTGTTAMGRQVNTQWLEDGSFLTAKNISLGYRFTLKNSAVLRSLRLYVSVQQAFVITGYTGINPEINNNGLDPTLGIGVDENAYPVPRTFSIGLSTTFK